MKDRWERHARITSALVVSLSLALALAGCGRGAEGGGDGGTGAQARTPVVLASTTSTEDSGLFDVLEPAFEEAYPAYDLQITAVGTGQALEIGKNKDADVLLVHAKADEEAFVAEGFGTRRTDVMYNDFVIVGPAADPAGIGGTGDAPGAMKRIADSAAVFASRGDDSGTHKKELKLWEAAGVEPEGKAYLSAGQGMGETLKIAAEKQAYTLADRATWLSMRGALDLELLLEGDDDLFNQYGVIPVTDASNAAGARAFADWLVGEDGQRVIREFGVETYGEPLFVPNAP
ncbi:MAG: substrate-binding domain-containing protein [Coriobacteriia bacterium]|nr:substrate-binding domain-containing protein [Coriobacteriia bacterium]